MIVGTCWPRSSSAVRDSDFRDRDVPCMGDTFGPIVPIFTHRPARGRFGSHDRSRSWIEWMLEKKDPAAKESIGDPVDALQSLAQELYIVGTQNHVL